MLGQHDAGVYPLTALLRKAAEGAQTTPQDIADLLVREAIAYADSALCNPDEADLRRFTAHEILTELQGLKGFEDLPPYAGDIAALGHRITELREQSRASGSAPQPTIIGDEPTNSM